jgi:hypothetical protein
MSKQQKHKGANVVFQGTIGAQKRLASCGLTVVHISMYRGGLGFAWEADVTDRSGAAGKRWVKFIEHVGWKILKEPPTTKKQGSQEGTHAV